MSVDRLQSALGEGEALRFNAVERRGGVVGLTDERLVIVSEDEVTVVPFENVDEATVQSFDWFLGLMSVLLVGFGVYSTRMNVLAGLAFAVAGLASLYLTYRKRGRVRIRLHTRAKPVTVYLSETDSFEAAFERQMDGFRATREESTQGRSGE